MHDWGAAFGLNYAWRHADNVKGIAFMEGVMPPTYPRESYASFGNTEEIFRGFRDPVRGPELIIEKNFFLEGLLPVSVMRNLTPAELEVYRAPFAAPKSRRAILHLLRDNPIEEKPANVWRTFEEMATWWR